MHAEYILFYSKFCQHSKRAIDTLSMSNMRTITTPICVDDKKNQLPQFVTAVPLLYSLRAKQKYLDSSLFSLIQQHELSHNAQDHPPKQADDFRTPLSSANIPVPGPHYQNSDSAFATIDGDHMINQDSSHNSLNEMFAPSLMDNTSSNSFNTLDRPQPVQASKEGKTKGVEDAFERLITARNQEKMQSMIRR